MRYGQPMVPVAPRIRMLTISNLELEGGRLEKLGSW